MLKSVNSFVTLFGASVIVPLALFLVALGMRVKWRQAVQSALRAGVALTGFGWLVAAFTPGLTKLIRQLTTQGGLHLPVVDLGWQAGSLAAFTAPIGLITFLVVLVLEFVFFGLRITKILMPTNLWNNFGYMIWAVMAYQVTKSLALALGLAIFMLLYGLALAEVQADAWSTYYGVPNATVGALHNVEQTVPAILLDPLWNLLGLNRWHLTPTSLKDRLGTFGEPLVLGAVLGLGLGLVANWRDLGQLKAWSQLLQFAIQLAAVMTIFPLVTNVFADAFKPLAAAINRPREGGRAPQVPSRQRWFLGVDDGIGYGESATLIAGVVLIPLVVAMAVLLPGNRVLPMVDLVSIPFMIESIVALNRGNLVKVIATSLVWFALGLYMASWLAPDYTAALAHYGVALPTGVLLVTSFNLMARPLNGLVFLAFASKNPVWIGLCLLAYLGLEIGLRRFRPQIWAYLRRRGAMNLTPAGAKTSAS